MTTVTTHVTASSQNASVGTGPESTRPSCPTSINQPHGVDRGQPRGPERRPEADYEGDGDEHAVDRGQAGRDFPDVELRDRGDLCVGTEDEIDGLQTRRHSHQDR